MVLPAMFLKALAVLLILSWITLSGFDVLEDLGSSVLEIHESTDANPQGLAKRIQLANNIIELADHSKTDRSAVFEKPLVQLPLESPSVSPKTLRLHKFHRVFLI